MSLSEVVYKIGVHNISIGKCRAQIVLKEMRSV